MKKILSILVLALIVSSCETKEKQVPLEAYTIEGNAEGIYNGIRVYINEPGKKGKLITKEEALVIDEHFSFKGKMETPKLYYITVNGLNGRLPILLDNSNITITIDKNNFLSSKIEGSILTDEIKEYATGSRTLKQKVKALSLAYDDASFINDTEEMKRIKEESKNVINESNNYPVDFIKNHKNSYASLHILKTQLESRNVNLDKLTESFDALGDDIKKSQNGIELTKRFDAMKKQLELSKATEIGREAPKFSAPDTNGKTVALNDIKGKVTIIDFWASWCGPCRRENPNVVKVYNKYHDKGLEIISVSLDRNGQKDRWLKAIEDDKMNWHHVSNLQYWKEPVAKLYNVKSIPATFIIDENGVIVAKSLRGIALENKISEMLD
jgi:peroxiredoxin